MPYAIDLFCGAGGMSEGLLQAGFHIIYSNDLNKEVEKTYKNRHKQLGYVHGVHTIYQREDVKNLSGKEIFECIKDLEIFNERTFPESIDAIFGGPPCQGFSRAGKRNSQDPRNLLFKEYLRLVSEINPKYVIMENVEGFMDTTFENFVGITNDTYKKEYAPVILRKEFSKIGYCTLEPRILDASNYGVPQRRKRAIFIAYKNGLKEPKYPEQTHNENAYITIENAISDVAYLQENKKTKLTQYQKESINGRTPNINGRTIKSDGYNNIDLANHTNIIIERFSLFNEGENSLSLRKRIICEGIDISNKPCLLSHCCNELNMQPQTVVNNLKIGEVDKSLLNILLTKKNIRKRLDKKKRSSTVVTLPDDYISPFANRILTVRELARLQSFDDSFEFLGKRTTGGMRRKIEVPQYSQVGNAVPPLLAKAIAYEIIKVLNSND